MDYKHTYLSFVRQCKAKEPDCYRGLDYPQRQKLGSMASGQYIEHHHIIPRHRKGTDKADNIVSFGYGDHLKAHYYYAKWVDTRGAWEAASMMAGMTKRARDFELTDELVEMAEEARLRFIASKQGELPTGFAENIESQRCTIVYEWEHKETGELFSGTLTEAAKKTGIPSNKLSAVAKGHNLSRNGWKLRGTEITPSHIQQRDNTTFRFIQLDTREVFEGTRWEFLAHLGETNRNISGFIKGRPATFGGWAIDDGRVITSGKYANTTYASANPTLYKWRDTTTGETMEETISGMRKRFGGRSFEDVVRGRQWSSKGWHLDGVPKPERRPRTGQVAWNKGKCKAVKNLDTGIIYYGGLREAAAATPNTSSGSIWNAISGRQNRAGGYRWAYVD